MKKQTLFLVLLVATIINILIPDPIPFIDEIIMIYFTAKNRPN